MPLVATTMTASLRSTGATRRDTRRRCSEGGTSTTSSASLTTALMSVDARSAVGSWMPGRNVTFWCRSLTSAATSSSFAHIVTSWSSRAAWLASAVPQAPAPTTATRTAQMLPELCVGAAGGAGDGAGPPGHGKTVGNAVGNTLGIAGSVDGSTNGLSGCCGSGAAPASGACGAWGEGRFEVEGRTPGPVGVYRVGVSVGTFVGVGAVWTVGVVMIATGGPASTAVELEPDPG